MPGGHEAISLLVLALRSFALDPALTRLCDLGRSPVPTLDPPGCSSFSQGVRTASEIPGYPVVPTLSPAGILIPLVHRTKDVLLVILAVEIRL